MKTMKSKDSWKEDRDCVLIFCELSHSKEAAEGKNMPDQVKWDVVLFKKGRIRDYNELYKEDCEDAWKFVRILETVKQDLTVKQQKEMLLNFPKTFFEVRPIPRSVLSVAKMHAAIVGCQVFQHRGLSQFKCQTDAAIPFREMEFCLGCSKQDREDIYSYILEVDDV